MVVGGIMTNVAIFQGESSVMFTSYVPMQAAPHFYLGIILVAVGALIGTGVFFGTLVVAKKDKTYQGSLPLVTFGAMTAAIIATFTILSGAGHPDPDLLLVDGLDQGNRRPVVPHGVVGAGALVAADQRGRTRFRSGT